MRMTLVRSWCMRYSRRSDSSMSALLPTETIAEMPMFSTAVLPIIASPSAPLCVIIATLPGLIPPGPKLASSLAEAENIPKMFGPMMRMPRSLA